VHFLITNVNTDLNSAMTRINVQVTPARKVMESVGSRKFRDVFVRKKVHFVRLQDNVVVTCVKIRNAINFEIYVELKVIESVGSRKFRVVFVRKKVDFVWLQDNVVVTCVKRRIASNFKYMLN